MHWHPYISEQLVEDRRRELIEQAQTNAARHAAPASRTGSLGRLVRIARVIDRVRLEPRREQTPAAVPAGRQLSVST